LSNEFLTQLNLEDTNRNQLEQILKTKQENFELKQFAHYREILSQTPTLTKTNLNIQDGVVHFSNENFKDFNTVKLLAEKLIKWKKGPFNLFGLEIDGEWRSDFKWNRIKNHLPDLKNKKILDIGCNNGYFLYQLLEKDPSLIWGIDPTVHFYTQFSFLEKFYYEPRINFSPIGLEEIEFTPNTFDCVLSMGILYHHRSVVDQLKLIKNSLVSGGCLILETIGIEGELSSFFLPPDRYAKMRNVWFFPTLEGLKSLCSRLNFQNIEVVSTDWMGEREQRSTIWCPGPSYTDFLSPCKTKTIEGHPLPQRFIIKAYKK
jgi:tRNA (mo5U34)-methyltransferase